MAAIILTRLVFWRKVFDWQTGGEEEVYIDTAH
jgi:hypothetical protein